MSDDDIRWKQHFKSYKKVLGQLTRILEKRELNELEERGLIKIFEYNYELAFSTLKHFLEYQGEVLILDYQDVLKKSFKYNILGIENHKKTKQKWSAMIKSRKMTIHTYNEDTVQNIITAIKDHYFSAFCDLNEKLTTYLNCDQELLKSHNS
ncbi:MAG: nucleotidyltransferase substrate binding protein [Magnetococcales bacterium]|nr:nucleotidyltransferase substrate binding protein [Magnetococcales bacterium]